MEIITAVLDGDLSRTVIVQLFTTDGMARSKFGSRYHLALGCNLAYDCSGRVMWNVVLFIEKSIHECPVHLE